jgi:CO/xanthine dehydrogenase Mo-binding subunit
MAGTPYRPFVNPHTVRAQIQSGIIFGATAAFHGEITLKNGRVEQTNFDTYQRRKKFIMNCSQPR